MGRRTGAKRMEQAMGAYFAQCDGTRERVPVYLERAGREEDVEAVNSRIAQNENNLNQDLSILYNKLFELEAALAAQEQG